MNSFPYKGYGRIIVKTPEEKQKVIDLIKEIDDFEFPYMPKDVIAVEKQDTTDVVYIGKFEPDLDELIQRCKQQGISIVIKTMTSAEYEGIFDD